MLFFVTFCSFLQPIIFVHLQSSSGLETLKCFLILFSSNIDKTHVQCVPLLRFTVRLYSSVSTDKRPVHPSRPTFELCHLLVYVQFTPMHLRQWQGRRVIVFPEASRKVPFIMWILFIIDVFFIYDVLYFMLWLHCSWACHWHWRLCGKSMALPLLYLGSLVPVAKS